MSTEEKKPRITSITIENFKGIGAPVTIPLKPITLLFGKNSVGKSTIIEALLLMHDWLQRLGPDLDTLTLGGDFINLGGVKQFVHNHDVAKNIRIRIDCSLGDEKIPTYPSVFHDFFESEAEVLEAVRRIDVNELISIESCFVEITVRPGKKGNAFVREYKTGINNEWVSKKSVLELSINRESMLVQQCMISGDSITEQAMWSPDWNENFSQTTDILCIGILDSLSVLNPVPPNFSKPIEVNNFTEEESPSNLMHQQHLCSQLNVGIGFVISEILSGHRFLGPLRIIPKPEFSGKRAEDISWVDGSAAWVELVKPVLPDIEDYGNSEAEVMEGLTEFLRIRHSPETEDYGGFIEYVTQFLEVLKFKYSLKVKTTRLIEANGPALDFLQRIAEHPYSKEVAENLAAALADIQQAPAYRSVVLVDNMTGAELRPNDLGTGVSQLIPVLVGIVMPFRLYSVEQPELHLHPAMQCDLGDTFIMGLDMDPDGVTIIETHSEHLILRLLRRIRETTNGQIPNGNCDLQLTPDDLSVLYIDQASDGMRVNHLRVDENGQFMDEWPEGFFEEGFNEIVGGL